MRRKMRVFETTCRPFHGNENRILAVKACSLAEAIGAAIQLFGMDSVIRIYDPLTGETWRNDFASLAQKFFVELHAGCGNPGLPPCPICGK